MTTVAEIVFKGCSRVLLGLLTTGKSDSYFNKISKTLWARQKCLAVHMLDTPELTHPLLIQSTKWLPQQMEGTHWCSNGSIHNHYSTLVTMTTMPIERQLLKVSYMSVLDKPWTSLHTRDDAVHRTCNATHVESCQSLPVNTHQSTQVTVITSYCSTGSKIQHCWRRLRLALSSLNTRVHVVTNYFNHHWAEGISILIASLIIWSITQSSKPNQRTNDATCHGLGCV